VTPPPTTRKEQRQPPLPLLRGHGKESRAWLLSAMLHSWPRGLCEGGVEMRILNKK
jgi:hypothetical protein